MLAYVTFYYALEHSKGADACHGQGAIGIASLWAAAVWNLQVVFLFARYLLGRNMSSYPIEVPMQPYAGRLLIIEHLIVPDVSDDQRQGSGKKAIVGPKFSDMPRPSFFEPKVIEKTLLKYCILEGISKDFKDELVDALLSAVETYMKYLVRTVIELCEHRSGNNLYNDPRCVVQHNMRTTMMFLNDREVADYGCSDDDSAYGHRR